MMIYQPEVPDVRFQCFIIFEPASARISPVDVMFRGVKVKEFYDQFLDYLLSQEKHELKDQILLNRLSKIGQMLELLQHYDKVVVSKFFDRIWRRYSYISHLGEHLFDMETFFKCFPEHKKTKEEIVAQRRDEEDEFEITDDEDQEQDALAPVQEDV